MNSTASVFSSADTTLGVVTQPGQEKQRSGYYLEEAERILQRTKHNLKSHQTILRIRIQPGKPGKPEGQNWVEKWSVPTGEVGAGAPEAKPLPAGVCTVDAGRHLKREEHSQKIPALEKHQ